MLGSSYAKNETSYNVLKVLMNFVKTLYFFFMFLKPTFISIGKPIISVPVNNALVSIANATAVSKGILKSVSNRTYAVS